MLTCEEMNPIMNSAKVIVLRLGKQDFSTAKQITLIRLDGDFTLAKRPGREVCTGLSGPEP